MATTTRPYTILAQPEDTNYDPLTNVSQHGVRFKIHWLNPDAVFSVFLPDGYVNDANLYAAAMAIGNERRKIVGLAPLPVEGQTPAAE